MDPFLINNPLHLRLLEVKNSWCAHVQNAGRFEWNHWRDTNLYNVLFFIWFCFLFFVLLCFCPSVTALLGFFFSRRVQSFQGKMFYRSRAEDAEANLSRPRHWSPLSSLHKEQLTICAVTPCGTQWHCFQAPDRGDGLLPNTRCYVLK